MPKTKTIQTQPTGDTETTALLKQSPSASSLSSSIRSNSSLSELNLIQHIFSFRINRYKKRICCNFSRLYNVYDETGNESELVFHASQENSYLSNDYEDMFIYNMQEQLMFSIEFSTHSGYFSTQMKFSVVSSSKVGLGSILRVCGFMQPVVYEILNWDDEHLFSIGPPTETGIKSYDLARKYEVISNDGKGVATIVQERKTISMKYSPSEPLQLRDKTLILALGFILDLLKNEEI
ncbi:hypothetical protein Ocin01_16068 [Orchesella cincta]|uniref:Phospholipid scramblase n=1 Tax=Orchesella cincta TaxID=48709 RepID=A0A1D2MCA8_ORCCI|nr:hypothetical protein Ocin01_16068 [Orchesella cincta]